MLEFHPVTDWDNAQLKEKRIILGSFPTHPFTRKNENEPISKSTGYFYGGERNRFWLWYAEFIDHQAKKESVETLRNSLAEHGIGITDIIYSCERKGVSASDNDLKNRIYNHRFLPFPEANEVIRILCTSKGVMNNMLLSPVFFKEFPELAIDEQKSRQLQEKILKSLDPSPVQIPLARTLKHSGGGNIEIVALPSPGSPFRSLKNFGFQKGDDAKMYLKIYLKNAFSWFLG